MTDTRKWRVGTHYGIHLYAYDDLAGAGSVPLGTALTPEIAKQIVNEHNDFKEHRQLQSDFRKMSEYADALLAENKELERDARKSADVMDSFAAERDRLQRRLDERGATPAYLPAKGDRVRHVLHGDTGTVIGLRFSYSGKVEIVAKNLRNETCHWFLYNVEPAPADDAREYQVGDTVTVGGTTFTKHAELPNTFGTDARCE